MPESPPAADSPGGADHVAARAMVARGEGGKIITVRSMYSLFGPPIYPNYAATKTGIVGSPARWRSRSGAHRIRMSALLSGPGQDRPDRRAWDSDWA